MDQAEGADLEGERPAGAWLGELGEQGEEEEQRLGLRPLIPAPWRTRLRRDEGPCAPDPVASSGAASAVPGRVSVVTPR
ncbi:hypothetical protein SMD44_00814 [Streptomyces alboflavus]|uniref:Uncharacterized protein n=1 Tax=Streptomyces alboflavus TaxID=67267 RepID=A0A1Z1W4R4_9ACTN|nr:hypothetical protein SMD44_00814 [Streptomyces alboflavus]